MKGDIDKFYVVTFKDGGWLSNATTELELGRSSVNVDGSWSGSLIAFFKSQGKVVPSISVLEIYKELVERILTGTRGAPASKLTGRSEIVQTERLEMVNKTIELIK